jgi:hypothetical protein
VKKSSPSTSLSPEGNLASPAGNPLLGPAAAKKSSGKPLAPIASVAMVVVAIVVSVILLIGHRQKYVHTPAELTPDADPPVTSPAAKEFVRPAAGELPGADDLAKNVAALLAAAQKVPGEDEMFVGNGRAKRWEIRFPSGNTAETYAHLLDGLRIELGLIGGGDKISYASGFTKAKPAVREAPAAQERRFYMTWRSGPLHELDTTMLSRVGLTVNNRVVAQFFPVETEKQLAEMEQQFADKHTLSEIRRTVFGLTATDKDYMFAVVEQEYMNGEVKVLQEKRTAKPRKEPKKKP